MTTKYRNVLAITAVATLGFLMVAPAQASTGGTGTTFASVETMGTIHVVNVVINDNLGVKTPADFQMYLKHFGTDVVGSPFVSGGSAGVTFVVAPGTYVVSQDMVAGYTGGWSGVGFTNGFIDLQAGQEVTITRTNQDDGVAEVVVEVPVTEDPVTGTSVTEDGGTLPTTGSPLFNTIAVALLISVAGVVGMRRSVVLRNRSN